MVWDHGRWIGVGLFLAAVFLGSPAFAQTVDPQSLIAEGERLVWLRAWTKAEPLFSQAERAFAASGDRRNALYAAINALRGRLPRLAVLVVIRFGGQLICVVLFFVLSLRQRKD